jgi:hypothetical protein
MLRLKRAGGENSRLKGVKSLLNISAVPQFLEAHQTYAMAGFAAGFLGLIFVVYVMTKFHNAGIFAYFAYLVGGLVVASSQIAHRISQQAGAAYLLSYILGLVLTMLATFAHIAISSIRARRKRDKSD